MRKTDVFGRKQNLTRPFYLIILIFALVLPGYFIIQNYYTQKNDTLNQERLSLQSQVNQLIAQSETEALLEIDEMIPYLPSTFSQSAITSELNTVKDLAGLTFAQAYSAEFDYSKPLPFDETLPSTLKSVKITISMTIDDSLKTLDYLDHLIELDTLYYIENVQVTQLSSNQFSVILAIYTFYNDIIIS